MVILKFPTSQLFRFGIFLSQKQYSEFFIKHVKQDIKAKLSRLVHCDFDLTNEFFHEIKTQLENV